MSAQPTVEILAFSFALRTPATEPNPCNIRLAKIVERLAASEDQPIAIVSQWEISLQLVKDGLPPAHSVELRQDGSYLGSKEVWQEAKQYYNQHGVRTIIVVAQPFLQLPAMQKMIQADGFKLLERPIGYIGFDRQSTQWWTRGRLRFLVYLCKIKLTGRHGKAGKQ